MDISLVLLKKDGKKVFPVKTKATTLGRRPDCDLCIPLQVVSRRHCQLSQEENTLKLRDLSSSNGTFLNGQKVGGETELKAGDQFQVGPLTFAVQIDGQPDASLLLPDTAILQSPPDISDIDEDVLNQSGTFTG